jgi:hypothetical protein
VCVCVLQVVYNLALCSMVILPIVWFLVVDVTALLAIEALSFTIATTVSIALIFVPKVLSIRAQYSVKRFSTNNQRHNRARADRSDRRIRHNRRVEAELAADRLTPKGAFTPQSTVCLFVFVWATNSGLFFFRSVC